MATLKLYKNTKITPDKNFLVEDVEQYLATFSPIIIPEFLYIKHDLSLSINVDIDASENLNPFQETSINYVSIQNPEDSKPVYYYVVDKKYLANQTLRLSLEMDTLNTFQGYYTFDKKTNIIREHRDRFYNEKIIDSSSKETYAMKIDEVDEGYQPILYNNENTPLGFSPCYLVFRSNNKADPDIGATAPVYDVLLAYDKPVEKTLNYYQIDLSKVKTNETVNYFFGGVCGFNTYENGDLMAYGSSALTVSSYCLVNQGTYFILYELFKKSDGKVGKTRIYNYDKDTNLYFTIGRNVYTCNNNTKDEILADNFDSLYTNVNSKCTIITPDSVTEKIVCNSVSTLDITDSKLNKIIWFPFDLSTRVNSLAHSKTINWISKQDFTAATYIVLPTDFKTPFLNQKGYTNPFRTKLKYHSTTDDLRNDLNESKLYNSSFNLPLFVFDSFEYPIYPEYFDYSYLKEIIKLQGTYSIITAYMTSTFNNTFYFDYSNLIKYKDNYKMSNYPYLMNINRNNEIPLVSSDYIYYMKNGYNYDVKAKNRQILGSALNLVGTAASLATPFVGSFSYSGGYKIKDPVSEVEHYRRGEWEFKRSDSPISLIYAAQAINNIGTNITNMVAAEQTFNQKQQEMENKGISVSNTDCVDLMKTYTNQQMKFINKKVSDKMYKLLADLFYYQGYASAEQKVPDTHSRQWFNFLKCEAVLNNTYNLERKYIENIKQRYSIGATILHHKDSTWDFEQVKANNEIWMGA